MRVQVRFSRILRNSLGTNLRNTLTHMLKHISYVMFIILCSILILPIISAATLHGTIYDLALEPMDSIVKINTVPEQSYVAKNGLFEFNINPGTYILTVNSPDGSERENITIVDDGEYVMDIVVGLDFDEPISFLDEDVIVDTGMINSTNSVNWFLLIFILALFILGMFIVFYIRKNSKKNSEKNLVVKPVIEDRDTAETKSEDISDISDIGMRTLSIIRKESRITQKDLRKSLPFSEAKISLVVADLESQGKIKKIKKGRGNILVYVKG
jgi:uncharacterized membrane protein